MTDKELRKLKRAELLEILFYLQNEIDELKQENQELNRRIEEFTKNVLDNSSVLSDEALKQISQTVEKTVLDCLKSQEDSADCLRTENNSADVPDSDRSSD